MHERFQNISAESARVPLPWFGFGLNLRHGLATVFTILLQPILTHSGLLQPRIAQNSYVAWNRLEYAGVEHNLLLSSRFIGQLFSFCDLERSHVGNDSAAEFLSILMALCPGTAKPNVCLNIVLRQTVAIEIEKP